MHNKAFKQVTDRNSMVVALEGLGQSIAQWTDKGDQLVTAIPGLSLYRRDETTQPMRGIYETGIFLIAQGAKTGVLGDETELYEREHLFITPVHLTKCAEVI